MLMLAPLLLLTTLTAPASPQPPAAKAPTAVFFQRASGERGCTWVIWTRESGEQILRELPIGCPRYAAVSSDHAHFLAADDAHAWAFELNGEVRELDLRKAMIAGETIDRVNFGPQLRPRLVVMKADSSAWRLMEQGSKGWRKLVEIPTASDGEAWPDDGKSTGVLLDDRPRSIIGRVESNDPPKPRETVRLEGDPQNPTTLRVGSLPPIRLLERNNVHALVSGCTSSGDESGTLRAYAASAETELLACQKCLHSCPGGCGLEHEVFLLVGAKVFPLEVDDVALRDGLVLVRGRNKGDRSAPASVVDGSDGQLLVRWPAVELVRFWEGPLPVANPNPMPNSTPNPDAGTPLGHP
jgi:hypothetical protein